MNYHEENARIFLCSTLEMLTITIVSVNFVFHSASSIKKKQSNVETNVGRVLCKVLVTIPWAGHLVLSIEFHSIDNYTSDTRHMTSFDRPSCQETMAASLLI